MRVCLCLDKVATHGKVSNSILTARNHMRNMNAGDKAFFYHSNCKEPSIAGVMEIVKEFSEDGASCRLSLYQQACPLTGQLTATLSERSPPRNSVLRSAVHKREAPLESGPRRVSQEVRGANHAQGAAGDGQGRRRAGGDADAQAEPAECEPGQQRRVGGAVQGR